MAFILDLPNRQVLKHFIIKGVHTKSSLGSVKTKQEVKDSYHNQIKQNCFPVSECDQYIVCVQITCSKHRGCPYPDAENVTKEIVDVLFRKDSVEIVKGVQTEAEILDICKDDERSEVWIYCV